MELSKVSWLKLGSTEEHSELKKDIANVCRDVTEACQINEICINDIVVTFKQHGYTIIKEDSTKTIKMKFSVMDTEPVAELVTVICGYPRDQLPEELRKQIEGWCDKHTSDED